MILRPASSFRVLFRQSQIALSISTFAYVASNTLEGIWTRYKLQSLYGCTHSALVTVLVSSNYLHFFATALLDNRSCVALHCIHLLQYAFTVKKCEVTLVDAVWERSSTRDEPNVGTCQFGLGVFLSIHHLVSCSLGWFRIGWWLLYLALTRAYCSISRRGQNFWQHREGAHRSHQKRNQRWCLQWRRFLQLLPCFYQALYNYMEYSNINVQVAAAAAAAAVVATSAEQVHWTWTLHIVPHISLCFTDWKTKGWHDNAKQHDLTLSFLCFSSIFPCCRVVKRTLQVEFCVHIWICINTPKNDTHCLTCLWEWAQLGKALQNV